MASTKVVYENNGIVYIEPNYTDEDVIMTKSEDTNEWSISDRKMTTPKLENYCVAVELSVQVPKRGFIGSSNRNGGTYVLSWDGSKTNVSFFGGTEINGEQYYTTAPYEYTTLKDVLNADGYASTTECFGIKSINVRYDNYAVPTVEMELTDIRGMSLFSPEEMRHSKVQGGIPSSADDLISGSFFKCFFMFPYPKFQFTMKGFYGEPLSYELTCADFRASFNASSGNFNSAIFQQRYIA